ncbi:MAG: acetyl-CoA carboxylase biotin carboxyl carrier protein [Acidobacteria bacterium]|nr:acetyl-CoA carboxylase biotin carboxyl carrier protein [Acidobacteriota bacterium]
MKKTERRSSRTNEPTSRPRTVRATVRSQSEDQAVGSAPSENLTLLEIKELIELVSDKQFNEFELERGDFRLRLHKGGAPQVEPSPAGQVVSVVHPTAPPVAVPSAAEPSNDEKLHIITSPIVGTFYRSPSPTAESFVKAGDTVEVGRTLCIIEAMKLMNEIQSDAMGVVAKIFVDNGQPVEYGQPLFGLKL